MKMIHLLFAGLFILAITGSGLAGQTPSLTVMTHDSFSISQAVIEAFENQHGVKVQFLKAGDAGAALNQAILSKNNPLADLFFGVDNTFLGRALASGIFQPYDSPLLAGIPDQFMLDPQHRLLPIDYGDVCLNYDKQWFADHDLAPPANLSDLIDPRYKGLLVVENPATSSPGLAFLLTTIGVYGPEGYLDFWGKLKRNDVLVVNGWQEAYWGHFSAASDGDQPIVVSYASSPPAEVYFSEKKLSQAPTAAVVGPDSAFRQIEFAGVLTGAKHPDLARQFIDFMLDRRFQEDIPLQMFVFPVNPQAKLPEVFVAHATVADKPVQLTPANIAVHRDQWIREFTKAVLR